MDPDLILEQWRAASDTMQTRLQRTIDLARTALKIEAVVTPDQLYASGSQGAIEPSQA